MAYRLELLERLKAYPNFHVSFLKPYFLDIEGIHPSIQRIPTTTCKQFDKDMEGILDRRVKGHSKKNGQVEYLLQWKKQSEAKAI